MTGYGRYKSTVQTAWRPAVDILKHTAAFMASNKEGHKSTVQSWRLATDDVKSRDNKYGNRQSTMPPKYDIKTYTTTTAANTELCQGIFRQAR